MKRRGGESISPHPAHVLHHYWLCNGRSASTNGQISLRHFAIAGVIAGADRRAMNSFERFLGVFDSSMRGYSTWPYGFTL